jgi:hypothetical protein
MELKRAHCGEAVSLSDTVISHSQPQQYSNEYLRRPPQAVWTQCVEILLRVFVRERVSDSLTRNLTSGSEGSNILRKSISSADMASGMLKALGNSLGVAITTSNEVELIAEFGSVPLYPEVPAALRRSL